jgi:putative PEP-CTERM system histidine kinase
MTAALILWTHALAAMLFGALAIWAWRVQESGVPRRPLALALLATSLWALAASGLGSNEMGTQVARTLRDLSWLGFMIVLHRRDGNARPPLALGTVYGVVGLVAIAALVLHGFSLAADPDLAPPFVTATLLLRMLVAVAGLVLTRALHASVAPGASLGLRWVVMALAGIWFIDFDVYAAAYLTGNLLPELLAIRGVGMTLVALVMAASLQRRDEWDVVVSRTVAYQSLSLVAIGAYFALLALASSAIATIGGTNARVLQTAFVIGSTAAILTLVSSPWLRAWAKVKLAKHFFRHRYDYRAEWMRFTETLGAPEGAAPLDTRIVKAIADLTDSPAGALLVPEGAGLGLGTTWNWDREDVAGTAPAALVQHLVATGRILDVDSLRLTQADSIELAIVPQWMLDLEDGWVLVPLPHQGGLAGAILLARPPFKRPLDWEDLDLLKVAGRQVASYLMEARAQEALADAQRFDEFNRRFAFIVHDIKNLVSQLSLTARNAERHADKPEFRADMIETLRSSAEKMNALLTRLSQNPRPGAGSLQAVEIVPLAESIAGARRGQHPVIVTGVRGAVALADAAGLEQLLVHLVQNAIDASPANEPITLAIGADRAHVTIDVVDRGSGMSPAFVRDKLFKPFVSSKPGGFGIGAFEARQLATAMDGRIEVSSREGEGTRFRVTLRTALAGTNVERAA